MSSTPTSDQLDLTPRDLAPARAGRNWLPIVLVVAIAVAIIFILLRTLGGAALFIYNADVAVERRAELGDDRFRLQGSPIGNTIDGATAASAGNADAGSAESAQVLFTVNFEGQLVDVIHRGSPAELFQPGVPVVLEGHWKTAEGGDGLGLTGGADDGYYFLSDNMIVKHDNDYRLENEERLDEAKLGGAVSQ